jgi:hypothetical protein
MLMDNICSDGPRMFRLWIATYADWRPAQWNQAPPRATALELVEDALYSADEAAQFLEGFNSLMLEHDQPIWAVAVSVTVRYEGDAQPGMSVQGHTFAQERAASDIAESGGDSRSAGSLAAGSVQGGVADALRNSFERDHFHGFGQSPQRSR